jgi:hypothetical protein
VAAGLGDVDVICSVDVPPSGNVLAEHIGYSERSFYWLERFESDDFHLQNGVSNNSSPFNTALYADGLSPDTAGTDIDVEFVVDPGTVTPHAIRFLHQAGSSDESRAIAFVEAIEDDFVFVRWRDRLDALTASGFGVTVEWFDASMASISTSISASAATALTRAWSVSKASFVAPSGSCYAKVSIAVSGMSGGDIYWEQFFVTTPKSGGFHDALPAAMAQSFMVAGFMSPVDPAADLGLIRFDSAGYFGIEAISSRAQVVSDTGIRLWSPNGDIEISPSDSIPTPGSILMAGGYGSSGVTISRLGHISTNGNLVVDGQATFAGGYGSTGVSISTLGNLSMNGNLTLDGTISRVVLATPATKSITTIFSGHPNNEMIYSTGSAPAWTQATVTHTVGGGGGSGRSIRKANGWLFAPGALNTGHFQFRTPSGCTIKDIVLLTRDDGDASNNGDWTVYIYTAGNGTAALVNIDEALIYKFNVTVNDEGPASPVLTDLKEVSLASDPSWVDIGSTGSLYLDIAYVLSAGFPTIDQRSLVGVKIDFEYTGLGDVPS